MIIAMDRHPSAEIELGDAVTVVHVAAANVVKDIRENIRNLIGGRMVHYEALIQNAINLALKELDEKAKAQGYDGVIGVRISHPVVVEGAVEVVAFGNMFKVVKPTAAVQDAGASAASSNVSADISANQNGDQNGYAAVNGREMASNR